MNSQIPQSVIYLIKNTSETYFIENVSSADGTKFDQPYFKYKTCIVFKIYRIQIELNTFVIYMVNKNGLRISNAICLIDKIHDF